LCPYAHQQNGVAERKHRHIVEMALALLTYASMPLKIWDKAFLIATHLINRTPTKLLHHDTPLHRILGTTPDYSNLRVFGCVCWFNLHPYNTHKLQFCSMCCAFLGYSNMHKGNKCLDISMGRVYISRDVVFDETMFPFAEIHPCTGACYIAYVLLLPTSPRAHTDLPVNNSPTNICLPSPVQLPSLQPQRIQNATFAPEDCVVANPGSTSASGFVPPGPSHLMTLSHTESALDLVPTNHTCSACGTAAS
jgi:hypothetical protein